jgi:UDP-N-acetylmuramoylalanine--D-glutamate ligase
LSCFAPQTIGITGTKGKSTTATLLYHILDTCNKPVCLAGNIGIPAFEVANEINVDTIVVMELSAQQLEHVQQSPHIAVLLNIYEEHLDYFGTYEKYAAAKGHIHKYQKGGDIFISQADIGAAGREIVYGSQRLSVAPGDTKLLGAHNLYNIGVVYALCQLYDITDSDFLAALRTYQPLPHRLEHIGCVGGADYYDDSISTNCETTMQALAAVENVGTLLLGGYERGLDYSPLIASLMERPVANIIFIPTTGRRIYEEMRARQLNGGAFAGTALHMAADLAEAVALAKQVTAKGQACLLSPAAASYDSYKNFEERGDAFRALVGV